MTMNVKQHITNLPALFFIIEDGTFSIHDLLDTSFVFLFHFTSIIGIKVIIPATMKNNKSTVR